MSSRFVLLLLALWLTSIASVALAQVRAVRVGILRSTDPATAGAFADEIDGALLRDLRAIAGIEDPMVSPVEYAEIQLSVGCADESRACIETIARAADVGALLVRELRTAEDGSIRVELRYFDLASADPPATVRGEGPAASRGALVAAMPTLVRKLFGIPEVTAPAQPLKAEAPAAQPGDGAGANVLPWIAIGAGAIALTAGIVVGAVAASDYDAWKKRPIDSMAQADEANAELDDLEDRALAANFLMPVGAVALAAGVVLLVLDGSDDDERAQARVAPARGGALVSVGGAW